MIHLHTRRKKILTPKSWASRVSRAFKDYALFLKRAQDFERKTLKRRQVLQGFAHFAPDALDPPKAKRRKRSKSPTRKKEAKFPRVWKYAAKTISDLSFGNCAYCQSPVEGGSYPEVDHYRPKSLFPTLAYDWSNYLLACKRCNVTKQQKWPDRGGYVRPDVARDPEPRFLFRPDGRIEAVQGDAAAKRTIEDLALNRPGLVRRRVMAITQVARSLNFVIGTRGSIDEQRTLARSYLNALEEPYSAAIRAWVRETWRNAYGRRYAL